MHAAYPHYLTLNLDPSFRMPPKCHGSGEAVKSQTFPLELTSSSALLPVAFIALESHGCVSSCLPCCTAPKAGFQDAKVFGALGVLSLERGA